MSTKQVYIFGFAMTFIVALILAGLREGTATIVKKNEEVFNKRAILAAVAAPIKAANGTVIADLSDEAVNALFDEQVEQSVIDANGLAVEGKIALEVDMTAERKKDDADKVYPIYEFNLDGKQYYIFSVIGNGLWDIIWGNIALEGDLSTVAGVSFDHAGETPGLGAEIKDNAGWKQQFVSKQVFKNGEFVGINVRKGGATDANKLHEVDGLSGATVTADGVTDMIYNGLSAYQSFIEEKRSQAGGTSMLLNQ